MLAQVLEKIPGVNLYSQVDGTFWFATILTISYLIFISYIIYRIYEKYGNRRFYYDSGSIIKWMQWPFFTAVVIGFVSVWLLGGYLVSSRGDPVISIQNQHPIINGDDFTILKNELFRYANVHLYASIAINLVLVLLTSVFLIFNLVLVKTKVTNEFINNFKRELYDLNWEEVLKAYKVIGSEYQSAFDTRIANNFQYRLMKLMIQKKTDYKHIYFATTYFLFTWKSFNLKNQKTATHFYEFGLNLVRYYLNEFM
ncbi:hypothetical protein [[Mycoplasma] testudinis]|uniref:hypothetical protein n=1 Tax=[Mycoplasma] testudinis TaxID=33924 RepID=UPI000487EA06|nr:hypothetical protein [[Mycoplasma] testudinis]